MEELCESKNLQEIEEFANKAHKNNLSSVHEQVWDSFLQRINAPVEESVSKTSVDLLNTHIDIFDRTDMIATPVSIRRFRLLNTLRRLWVAPSATTYSHNPCTETYLTSYLNRRDVQQAMNVIRKGSSLSVSFSPCNSQIMSLYSVNDMQADVTKLYSQIVKHGNKPEGFSILILSGDTDLVSGLISFL